MHNEDQRKLDEFSKNTEALLMNFTDNLLPVLEKLYTGLLSEHGLEDCPAHWREFCWIMDSCLAGDADKAKPEEPESDSESESELPEIIPVKFKIYGDRNPKALELVTLFLNYQGNPAYNTSSNLMSWYAAFNRLLKDYPHLRGIMKFGFETSSFWSEKLVRDHEPLEYFEEKLESQLASQYAQIIKKLKRNTQHAAKKARASAPAPADKPRPDDLPPEEYRDVFELGYHLSLSRESDGLEDFCVNSKEELTKIFIKYFDYYKNQDGWNDVKDRFIEMGLINEQDELIQGEE